VVDGESSEAGNPGTLGMTKRGGSLQGQGGCWMKQWLLNRRIFQIEFGQLFQPSLRDFSRVHAYPGLASGTTFSTFSRSSGTKFANPGSHTGSKPVLYLLRPGLKWDPVTKHHER
jgi:hypothetical protein